MASWHRGIDSARSPLLYFTSLLLLKAAWFPPPRTMAPMAVAMLVVVLVQCRAIVVGADRLFGDVKVSDGDGDGRVVAETVERQKQSYPSNLSIH